MPSLCDLSKENLAEVFDFATDISALALAACSGLTHRAVDDSRATAGGPWCHQEGDWEVAGLWRFLGHGDIPHFPRVTLSCQVDFPTVAKAWDFFEAASILAAETIDGRVVFNYFQFDEESVETLFYDDEAETDQRIEADGEVIIEYRGHKITCKIAGENPFDGETLMTVSASHDAPFRKRPIICANSLNLPTLRLRTQSGGPKSGMRFLEEHALDPTSPLADLVMYNNQPLPMFFGIEKPPKRRKTAGKTGKKTLCSDRGGPKT